MPARDFIGPGIGSFTTRQYIVTRGLSMSGAATVGSGIIAVEAADVFILGQGPKGAFVLGQGATGGAFVLGRGPSGGGSG